jgi:hypothetical protein
LDNADSEEAHDSVIQLFKELAGGHFIVTSRRKDWPEAIVRKVRVDVFSPEEAVACLRSRYRRERKEKPSCEELAAFKDLAHELDYLPLALTLAASYMESRTITPQRYLREWKEKERQENLLEFVAKDVDYGRSLLVAFMVSFDCLSDSGRRLLCHLAWLASEAFPREQLEKSDFLRPIIRTDIIVALFMGLRIRESLLASTTSPSCYRQRTGF